MFLIRRISGSSMSPAIEPGQIVLIMKSLVKEGSIVLAVVNDREVIKRVESTKQNSVYIVGDNSHESTDSRHYGPIKKSAILGTVMIILPKATKPPKLVKPYGLLLGRIAAGVLVAMSLIHLFRIDTLVPLLEALLPGGQLVAGIVTVVIISGEIFAISFALRMRLSPLMHLFSGVLMVFAPLSWLWLSIWAFGTDLKTGQLGQFVPLYATALLLTVNVLWVAGSYYTLYTLGYNRLSLRSLLRK